VLDISPETVHSRTFPYNSKPNRNSNPNRTEWECSSRTMSRENCSCPFL